MLIAAAGYAGEVMLDGAEPGAWTMDYKAALQLAEKKSLPIMLNFTGSDWCGWCIRMDRGVFAKKEWTAFARENLVLVTLDFPRGKNKVPEKYEARNRQLQRKYGVRGYPSYILIDVDGKTVLRRLGAGRNKTVKSFIAEVEDALTQSSAGAKQFVKSLPAETAAQFTQYTKELKQAESDLKAWMDSEPPEDEENFERFYEESAKIEALKNKVEDIEIEKRAVGMTEKQGNAYRKNHTSLRATKADLAAWLQTEPDRSKENLKKLEAYNVTIKTLSANVEKF